MRLSDTPERDHLLPNLLPARGRDNKRYPSVVGFTVSVTETIQKLNYFSSVWGPKGQKGTILWLIIIFLPLHFRQSLYGLYAT